MVKDAYPSVTDVCVCSSHETVPHVGQTDHDLDRLDPNLPFRDVVQNLYCGTDPTQETCPGSCRLYVPTRQHELDRSC